MAPAKHGNPADQCQHGFCDGSSLAISFAMKQPRAQRINRVPSHIQTHIHAFANQGTPTRCTPRPYNMLYNGFARGSFCTPRLNIFICGSFCKRVPSHLQAHIYAFANQDTHTRSCDVRTHTHTHLLSRTHIHAAHQGHTICYTTVLLVGASAHQG